MSRADAPRIPWLAMVNVQVAGALVVMFGIFLVMNRGFAGEVFPLLLLGVIPVVVLGALPPFLVAGATWWLATAWGRGRVREVLAVMAGAVLGSLVPLLSLRLLGNALPPEWLIGMWGSIALCSAVAFAIWVGAAWRSRPAPHDPADSLN
jgi:hypothetical protein